MGRDGELSLGVDLAHLAGLFVPVDVAFVLDYAEGVDPEVWQAKFAADV